MIKLIIQILLIGFILIAATVLRDNSNWLLFANILALFFALTPAKFWEKYK